jgi:hypothetical protein
MTNLCRRISRLERSKLLRYQPPVMERFTAAFDEAARRLGGRSGVLVAADGCALDRVAEEAADDLFPLLNESDRDDLIDQLLQIGYGGDAAAKEAARQAATRSAMVGDGR